MLKALLAPLLGNAGVLGVEFAQSLALFECAHVKPSRA